MIARRDFLASGLLALPAWGAGRGEAEWRYYGGDAGCSRFSPLEQIRRGNVAKLRVAWTHRCGDATLKPATTIECTPLAVDGVLYLTTAKVQVRALNGATGEPLWNFQPRQEPRGRAGVNRGVAWFEDGKDRRVFAAVRDKLYCLNAGTGEPMQNFGDNGVVDLAAQFDRDMTGLSFRVTSPPVVFEDTVVVGGGGGEGPRPQAPGHIRGYDAYTGKRKWIFHTIPHPGEFGYDTWPPDAWKINGAANNWGGMSVDLKRGWALVSTGSASFDFWGGDRHGDNLFSDCVLALDARTGRRMWHFQTVHHDVWDYDLPAPPSLVSVRQGGRVREAVAQVTKTGFVFLLDRETGKPLFGVEERKTPRSDVDGENVSPTQPFPIKPRPLSRLEVNEDVITDISPEAREFVLQRFRAVRGGVPFAPPSRQGTIYSPGTLGGGLWGGCAFDPGALRLFVTSNELPSISTLRPGRPEDGFRFSQESYEKLRDHEGYPGVKPPWGNLTAIDLATGDFAWREPLGEYPALAARGKKRTGTFLIGGCIATAGGLVFVGASADEKFRAFDSSSGAVLWEQKLSAGGYATPCTYMAGGKQYVVIACGGAGYQPTPAGEEYVAFAV
jgi:quinoprotein glucose dehydrogenase